MNEVSLEVIVSVNNDLIKKGFSKIEIARQLGYDGEHASSNLSKRLRLAEKKGYAVLWPNYKEANIDRLVIPQIPSADPTAEELWKRREEEYARLSNHNEALNSITIQINESKPIGLMLFGDPHIDNAGCDVFRLRQDVRLARTTDGVYGVNIGDTTDNWIGYLSKLYAENEITRSQSYILMQDLINSVPWLFMTNGNHDCWESYPIKSLAEKYNVLTFDHEAKVNLQFANGELFKIHARHNYPGGSQWNTAHAIQKWARTRGRYDLLMGGHKHSCGYNWVVGKYDNDYYISHCELLGSYKKIDDYSIQGGFEDTNATPSVLYVINPLITDKVKRTTRFTDIEAGCEYLEYLRSKPC